VCVCVCVCVCDLQGRFHPDTGKPNPAPGHSTTLMSLGASILWFGWYGFNCGSTLAISGSANVAGKVAVTTTCSAASGCFMAVVLGRVFEKSFDIGVVLNGIIAGLVGVTASCALIDVWHSFLIGAIAACVYYCMHNVLLRLGIDDPLDAFPIHGCCGCWGLIAVGIFCTDANVQYAGYPNVNDACARGEQFGVQIIGALVIICWTLVNASLTFAAVKYTMGLRVSWDVEAEGLDRSEHGMAGYNDETIPPSPVHTLQPQRSLRSPPGTADGDVHKGNKVSPDDNNAFDLVQPLS